MRTTRLRSTIFLTATLAGIGVGSAPSTVLAQVCPTATEREVVALYNQERASAGLPPLAIDVRLVQSARGHSEDMAINDFFSHVGSNGSTFDQRILAAGYPSPRSENIAAGYSTPASVVAGWMGSSGHRANILDSAARHVGIGYAFQSGSTYGRYWTANMGRSSGSPQLPSPVCVTVWTNAGSFSTGDSISVSLQAVNFGDPSTVDFYFGVVLPGGNTVLLITNMQLQRKRVSASNVANWTPLMAGLSLATPFTSNRPNFLNYLWAGSEPAGTYTFFLTVAVPGSFADGTVNPGDVIHSSTAIVTFAP
ncbi:MAG: CAP domain-containing protein [Vicinamibacteria bacterium]